MCFGLTKMKHEKITAASVKMLAKITQGENGSIYGELSCMYYEEPFIFTGLMRMIEMMDTTFDILGFPEKQLLPRTFGKTKQRLRKNEIDLSALVKERTSAETHILPDGKTCNFEISVRTRHHGEWQGTVHLIEIDETKKFSGIVELLRQIDNAF